MRTIALARVLMVGPLAASLAATPEGQTQKIEIERQLQAQYPPTKLAGDKLRIAEPGTVLLVQISGMFASPLNEFAFTNTYRDGRIKRSLASSLIHDSKTSRELMIGERVYLLKSEVKDSGIVFSLQTCIACDGSNVDLDQMAYRASLTFQFPKGYLETTGFVQVQRAIGQVLTFADLGSPSAPATMQTLVPQAAQPAPQPGPVTQTEPAKIALGQTIEEVTANLGQPDRVVDLGNKKIYLYRDLKITFLGGKVSDVQ